MVRIMVYLPIKMMMMIASRIPIPPASRYPIPAMTARVMKSCMFASFRLFVFGFLILVEITEFVRITFSVLVKLGIF